MSGLVVEWTISRAVEPGESRASIVASGKMPVTDDKAWRKSYAGQMVAYHVAEALWKEFGVDRPIDVKGRMTEAEMVAMYEIVNQRKGAQL